MMGTIYVGFTVLFAALVASSGLAEIKGEPNQANLIHSAAGVPLKYVPLLGICELAGALGLVAGIWRPILGVVAGIGLLVYFAAAMVTHVRVGNSKATAPAVVVWVLAACALALRLLMMHP